MSVRLGIIGAGAIGEVHANAADKAGTKVAAIADLDLARATTLADKYDGCVSTDKIETLLADEAVDAVVVCVPNRWHKELAIQAMQAGKDVLLEKPMGLNATECAEINAAAAETKRILQVGMVYRYSSAGQAARQVVASGDLGTVYHAKAHLYRRRGVPGLGGWFTTKALSGGGPLIDLGVHIIDMTSWLMGFPKPERVSGKVYSYFGNRMNDYVYEDMWAGPPKLDGTCDVEDSAHAMIHFEGGCSLDLQVSWAINMPTPNMDSAETIGIFGDRGGLTFKLFGDHVDVATEQYGRNVDERILLTKSDQFVEQAKVFAHSVKTRETPPSTGEQGLIVQTIIDSIYQSSDTSQEVTLA
ncbi:MAG: Gfo/Idh/MocA family oxidoreductase [Planctomycetota bacterium]